MIRFRVLTAGVLLAGLLASSGVAFGQGPGRPGAGRPGGRGARLGGPGGALEPPLAQLNLSDAQRQQISDITKRRFEQGEQIETRLRAAREAQRDAIETVPVNEGAIRAATQELALAETDAAIYRAYTRAEIFGVLTADQQEQLKKLQAQREERIDARQDRADTRRERQQNRSRQ